MERKEFFAKAFTLAIGKGLDLLSDNKVVKGLEELAGDGRPRQRPPGALADDRAFQSTCTGCDQCMIACPVNVIMVDDLEKRHPVIFPEENPCIHCDGYPCIAACESGALSPEELSTRCS